MNLERYTQNGLELLINLENGEVFSCQNALVRMLEDISVPRTTLRDFLKGRNMGIENIEIPTSKGVRLGRLYTEDDIYEVFHHFNSPLLKQCAKCGIRVLLHQLAGYQVTSTAIQPKDTTQELLLQVLANQEEQKRYFNTQLAELRMELQQQNEKLAVIMPDHETMNAIREAVVDLRNIKPLLEAIAQSLKENPNQEKHPLKYYLNGKNCGRGMRVRIGQMVSNWMSLSRGHKLEKLNGFQNRATLYPECALPLIIVAWQILHRA